MLGSFKRFVQAIALMLAWQIPRSLRSLHDMSATISRSLKSEKKRRTERHRPATPVGPRVVRKIHSMRGYSGTQAKDRRFSNQRLLRRMFRNM
jgi:hypothetical protein